MARCGEKYADLIRSASGKKPDSRCYLYCNEADVEDWQEGTRTIRKRVMERAAQIVLSQELAANLGTWAAQVDSMSDPAWYPGEWGLQVGRAIALQGEGVCLLERVEEAGRAQGVTTSPIPGATPSGGGGGLGGLLGSLTGDLGTVALIGGAAYLLTRD